MNLYNAQVSGVAVAGMAAFTVRAGQLQAGGGSLAITNRQRLSI
jgi:hypothetical protein